MHPRFLSHTARFEKIGKLLAYVAHRSLRTDNSVRSGMKRSLWIIAALEAPNMSFESRADWNDDLPSGLGGCQPNQILFQVKICPAQVHKVSKTLASVEPELYQAAPRVCYLQNRLDLLDRERPPAAIG